ncbi:MAG: 30S ribosomal protein S6 [Candidatus Paceibacterota bacterium]
MAETDTQPVQENESEIITREYECAYLLMPTITEENVADEVQAIRSVIEKNSSALIKEKQPERIPLAYEMTIKREGKSDRFLEAYFGWVTFEAPSEAVNEIHDELSRNGSLIRFMVIRASAEQEPEVSEDELVSPQSEEEQELRGGASQADIDKSIDALVDEDVEKKETAPAA